MAHTGMILAVEGGATATRAGLYSADGSLLGEALAGPCNPTEYGMDQAVSVMMELADQLGVRDVATLVAGVAGAGRPGQRNALAARLAGRFANARVVITDDLYPVLAANTDKQGGVLAIAGTGSSVMALSPDGRLVRVGGRGRLFGDDGGAYGIAEAALRAAARAQDGVGPPTLLAERLLSALGMVQFSDLVPWSSVASKSDVAALAGVVDEGARAGDEVSQTLLEEQALRLAEQTCAAVTAARLGANASILMSGGVFAGSGLFRNAYERALTEKGVGTVPVFPKCLGHRAVLEVIRRGIFAESEGVCADVSPGAGMREELRSTERGIQGVALDRLSALEIVRAMSAQDEYAVRAVHGTERALASLVKCAARCIGEGGRIIYAGAGTSGRLGVLDASECPPTFGINPGTVIGLIAGGERALRNSVEGAEDDTEAAAYDLETLVPPVSAADLVVGIAASGKTPYVRAALERAKALGATTALIACAHVEQGVADHVVIADTGAEVLPGSTRLKAGTATKLILNTLSTGALALAGYVYDGQMVGVRPVNAKLRERAIRILGVLTGLVGEESARLLDSVGGDIRVAVLVHRKGLTPDAAVKTLKNAGGRLREALERE